MNTLAELHAELQKTLTEGLNASAAKIAALESQIQEVKDARLQAAKQTNGRPDISIGYKPTGNPEKDFNLLRFFEGVADDNFKTERTRKFPEYELAVESTAKAQLAGIDTAGGFMVAPEVFIDQIIPALEPRIAMLDAGATMITGLVGSPVEWPRFNDYLDGYWTEEYVDATEDELALSQMRMTPHAVASIVEITQRLMRQTSGRVETAVRNALARALARPIDRAVFKGAGGTQPVGILSQLGVGTVDVTAGSYTMASGASQEVIAFLEDMIGKLEDADALMGRPTWFMHPHTRRWFHKVLDSTGRPLLFEGLGNPVSSTAGGRTANFFGYPFRTSTMLTGNNSDADLVFANVEEVYIGQWGSLLVESDRSLGFKRGTTYLKAVMEVDVGLAHGASVASALNLDTTTGP